MSSNVRTVAAPTVIGIIAIMREAQADIFRGFMTYLFFGLPQNLPCGKFWGRTQNRSPWRNARSYVPHGYLFKITGFVNEKAWQSRAGPARESARLATILPTPPNPKCEIVLKDTPPMTKPRLAIRWPYTP